MSFRRSLAIGAATLTGVSLLAVVAIWLDRKDIARGYADTEMKRRGVPARYDITEIGPSRQRLEHVSIGDPAHPDLTAEWVEVYTRTGFSGVSVKRIRAGGVRVRGAYYNGELQLGALQKLLPAPTGAPFSLPDLDVDLRDARLRFSTPYGLVGARIDGKGNIASGFVGTVAAVMPSARSGECGGTGLSSYLNISTRAHRISAKGPLRFSALGCGGAVAGQSTIEIDGITDERFQTADADLGGQFTNIVARGWPVAGAKVDGRVGWQNGRLTADGTFAANGVKPDARSLAAIAAQARRAAATPVGPIGDALANAVSNLGRGNTASGRFAFGGTPGDGRLAIDSLLVKSVSGAQLRQADGAGLRIVMPGADVSLDGSFTLAGGGFPASTLSVSGTPAALKGTARIAPMLAGGARLALSPVIFSTGRNGVSMRTAVTLDGPLAGGMVRGLNAPLSVINGRLVGGCLPLSFQSLVLSSLSLSPARMSVCQTGDRISVASPRFAGRLGGTPLGLAAAHFDYDTRTSGFTADRLAARLGNANQMSALDVARLDGRYLKGIASGRFSGAAGRIGVVPLALTEGAGDWRFADSKLSLTGGLRVADTAADPRFKPLLGQNVSLLMAGGKITAEGVLHEPVSGTVVANVDLVHDLGPGAGHAVLDVPGLTFGQALQPEALTNITLGVIANVAGTVTGKGRINWTPNGVTSTGGFRTGNMDMAAAFGPVTGLKGEIALSNLLGLETPAGQTVTIGSINPGIPVTNGQVRYQLLPDLKIAVEGGHWPFAGGELILEPSVLDLNHAATRRLTFRVVGLDAALFVQQMAFENIAVTGKFDGVLPMVFDEQGGRIEGGELVVREGGGTLSYIGEVSNANLGRFSKLAFDALKSIKYKRLKLELNGSLDGEMVTLVRFDGVNQLPINQKRNFFLSQFDKIPFIFNITIRAPFRGLFATVRSINDPSVFLPTILPPQLQPVETPKPVQTKESDPVR